MKNLAFIGAGGHSDAVLAYINPKKYNFIGYFDDKDIFEYNNYPIIDKIKNIPNYLNDIDALFITIGDNQKRKEIFDKFNKFSLFINIISPSSVILKTVKIIGVNNFISTNTFIGANVKIDNNCIINSNATIEHHCHIGSHCNISPSATLNGHVMLSEMVYVGSSATIIQVKEISKNIIIGAGAVVVKDLEVEGTYIGIPARKLK